MTSALIRTATIEDIHLAASTLAAAFENYPWTRWTVPEDDYLLRLSELQGLYLEYALEAGIVLVDDDVAGVIALTPPNPPAPSSDVQERIAALHGDRLEIVRTTELPEFPAGYWTLEVVGVRPGEQAGGIGSALVRAGIAAVKTHSPAAGIALYTSDERNVLFYQQFGFEITAEIAVDDGPIVITMARLLKAGADE